jgi:hypothetical protein
MDYKKNDINTDREKGRGTKRARVTRGLQNPKHDIVKHYVMHQLGRLNEGNS